MMSFILPWLLCLTSCLCLLTSYSHGYLQEKPPLQTQNAQHQTRFTSSPWKGHILKFLVKITVICAQTIPLVFSWLNNKCDSSGHGSEVSFKLTLICIIFYKIKLWTLLSNVKAKPRRHLQECQRSKIPDIELGTQDLQAVQNLPSLPINSEHYIIVSFSAIIAL